MIIALNVGLRKFPMQLEDYVINAMIDTNTMLKYHETDKYKQYAKKYRESTNGKLVRLMCQQSRKAKKLCVNYWLPFYNLVWQWSLDLTFGYCLICCRYVGKDKLTMDHIIPLSKGGIHSIANVIPICSKCNCRKHNTVFGGGDSYEI